MTTSLFEVVAEPHRRRILDALRDGDRSVTELVELVVVRPEAQRRWYRLRPEPLRELEQWLEPYRRTWAHRLDALGDHLDRMEENDD